MSTANIQDFLTAINARREQCRTLLKLSQTQRELIDRDDYTQLLIVLGQKQRILAQLDQMKARHSDLVAWWKAERSRLDPETRDDCEHILAETETILAELIREEDSSTKQITQRRDTTHTQLQSLAEGRSVNRAYRDSLAPATHRHLDVNR